MEDETNKKGVKRKGQRARRGRSRGSRRSTRQKCNEGASRSLSGGRLDGASDSEADSESDSDESAESDTETSSSRLLVPPSTGPASRSAVAAASRSDSTSSVSGSRSKARPVTVPTRQASTSTSDLRDAGTGAWIQLLEKIVHGAKMAKYYGTSRRNYAKHLLTPMTEKIQEKLIAAKDPTLRVGLFGAPGVGKSYIISKLVGWPIAVSRSGGNDGCTMVPALYTLKPFTHLTSSLSEPAASAGAVHMRPPTSLQGFQIVAVFCSANEYQHRLKSRGLQETEPVASKKLLALMTASEEKGHPLSIDMMPGVHCALESGFKDPFGSVLSQTDREAAAAGAGDSAVALKDEMVARAVAQVTIAPLPDDQLHAISHYYISVPLNSNSGAKDFLATYNVDLMDLSGYPDPSHAILRQLLIRHVAPSLDIVCFTHDAERAQIQVKDAISMQECGIFTRAGPLPKLVYLSNHRPEPTEPQFALDCLTKHHSLEIAIAVAFNIDVESMDVFEIPWTKEDHATQNVFLEESRARIAVLDAATMAIAERELEIANLIKSTRSLTWLDDQFNRVDPSSNVKARYNTQLKLGDAIVEKRREVEIQRLREASDIASILLTEAKSVVKGKQFEAMAAYIPAIEAIINNRAMEGSVTTRFHVERQRRGNLEFIEGSLREAFDLATTNQDEMSERPELSNADQLMAYMAHVWKTMKDTFLLKINTSIQLLANTAQIAIDTATFKAMCLKLDKSAKKSFTPAMLIKLQTMMAGVWADSVQASAVSSLERSLLLAPISRYAAVQTTPPDQEFAGQLFEFHQQQLAIAESDHDIHTILRDLLIPNMSTQAQFKQFSRLARFASDMYASFKSCFDACVHHFRNLGSIGPKPEATIAIGDGTGTGLTTRASAAAAAASTSESTTTESSASVTGTGVANAKAVRTAKVKAIEQICASTQLGSEWDEPSPPKADDWELASELQQYSTLLKSHVMDRSHEKDTRLSYADWWKPPIVSPKVFEPANKSGIRLPEAPPEPQTLQQAVKEKTFSSSCEAIKQNVHLNPIQPSTIRLQLEVAAAPASSNQAEPQPDDPNELKDNTGKSVPTIRFTIDRIQKQVYVSRDINNVQGMVRSVISAASSQSTRGIYPIFVCSRIRSKKGNIKPELHTSELRLARSSAQPVQSLVFLLVESAELHLYRSLVQDSDPGQLILLVVPDQNLGIGRKRKLCMLLAEYFNMPYFYLMDDDLQFHEYSRIVCRPVPGSFSFVRACIFLQSIMQDAMCSQEDADVQARSTKLRELGNNREIVLQILQNSTGLNEPFSTFQATVTDLSKLASVARDPSAFLSHFDETKHPLLTSELRKMLDLNLNRLASVSTWNIATTSLKSYHQRLGDARRPTHCVSSVRFQFVLFNRKSIHGLHPVDDDVLFLDPQLHQERVAVASSLSKGTKKDKDKSKYSPEGLEAARLGIKFSDSIYNYKLLLNGKSGYQSIYFSHRDTDVRSLVNAENSELSTSEVGIDNNKLPGSDKAPRAAALRAGPIAIIRRQLNLTICFNGTQSDILAAVNSIVERYNSSELVIDRLETGTKISSHRTRQLVRQDGQLKSITNQLLKESIPLTVDSASEHNPKTLYQAVSLQLKLQSNSLSSAYDADEVKDIALKWLCNVAEDVWIQQFFVPVLTKTMKVTDSLQQAFEKYEEAHSSRKRHALWNKIVEMVYQTDDQYGDYLICLAIANGLSMSIEIYSSRGHRNGMNLVITPNTGLARGHIKLAHVPDLAFLSVTAEADFQAPQESDEDDEMKSMEVD